MSTVLPESVLCDLPVVTAKIPVKAYDSMGANITEVDWEVCAVCNAIKEAVNTESNNQAFKEYYFSHNLDGNGTDRVVKELRRVVG
jgi:hypothetical protein